MAFMFFATNKKKAILSWNVKKLLLIYSTFHFINLPFNVVEIETTWPHTYYYYKDYQQLPVL